MVHEQRRRRAIPLPGDFVAERSANGGILGDRNDWGMTGWQAALPLEKPLRSHYVLTLNIFGL
jgi:hypothetical protein